MLPLGCRRGPRLGPAREAETPAEPAALALPSAPEEGAEQSTLAPLLGDGLSAAQRLQARALAEGLSLKELCGQVLMVSVDGKTGLSSWGASYLGELKPGAVLLFGFNIPPVAYELRLLNAAIAETAQHQGIRPFIAIDHEGGDVFRIKSGVTRLPSAKALGVYGPELAGLAGALSGAELKALGVTMNLAPVAEALHAGNAAFLGTRAWSALPLEAGFLAYRFIEGSQGAGIAAAAKHFPGNSDGDPHAALPVLEADMAELNERYLSSFIAALRAKPAAIMLSHALIPALDDQWPVSLSAKAIALLKRDMGFGGIVLSDDLVMAALGDAGGPAQAALSALEAGADMLMVSGAKEARSIRDALLAALSGGGMDEKRLRDAAYRIFLQKLRFSLDAPPPELSARDFEALVEENRAALGRATSGL
jgi:beta-N-acetylhexosaminidase